MTKQNEEIKYMLAWIHVIQGNKMREEYEQLATEPEDLASKQVLRQEVL